MSKINKLGKSTFVIAILSFLLVAVLAFGGTYAYFSAQSEAVTGKVVTGHLRITDIGEDTKTGSTSLTATSNIVKPGQTIYKDKSIVTEVTSNISYFTRVRFDIDVTPKDGHTHFTDGWDHDGQAGTEAKKATDCGDYLTSNNYASILDIAIANGGVSGADKAWEAGAATVDYSAGEVVYYKLAETVVADNAAALNQDTYNVPTSEETFTFTIDVNKWVGDNGQESPVDAEGCEFWMDATITVNVIVEVIQSEFLTLTDGTGTVALVDIKKGGEGADKDTVIGHKFANGADAARVWAASLAVQK